MSEKAWTLEEIRKAYGEILRSWNALFSIHPPDGWGRKEEILTNAFETDADDDFDRNRFFKRMKEVEPRLKSLADQSGNAQTWRAGESLEGLNKGMKERVERALRFGI